MTLDVRKIIQILEEHAKNEQPVNPNYFNVYDAILSMAHRIQYLEHWITEIDDIIKECEEVQDE